MQRVCWANKKPKRVSMRHPDLCPAANWMFSMKKSRGSGHQAEMNTQHLSVARIGWDCRFFFPFFFAQLVKINAEATGWSDGLQGASGITMSKVLNNQTSPTSGGELIKTVVLAGWHWPITFGPVSWSSWTEGKPSSAWHQTWPGMRNLPIERSRVRGNASGKGQQP